jgi:hypothetical protein
VLQIFNSEKNLIFLLYNNSYKEKQIKN